MQNHKLSKNVDLEKIHLIIQYIMTSQTNVTVLTYVTDYGMLHDNLTMRFFT